ncbi:MAG: hypothetical protein DRR16_23435 [Candidatus Parabeggiatoa sp. nov. 3]|nr:MAG: hypothetical protein DRR00_33730 [Gammaproteobacteria bacterium]RKZ59522.1 MAG: hypothetical protein DRQ99_23615 [Gammaproteobacteria bacterium]RKZ80713.1 MAG: hypothetical protein DRR16_23435 [Gammaproteobacteria bacterium]
MDYRCPNCDINLKWKLLTQASNLNPILLHEKEVIIAGKCPKCNIKLGYNNHGMEQTIQAYILFIAIPPTFINILNQFEISTVIITILWVLYSLCLVIICLLTIKKLRSIPKSWVRYIEVKEV